MLPCVVFALLLCLVPYPRRVQRLAVLLRVALGACFALAGAAAIVTYRGDGVLVGTVALLLAGGFLLRAYRMRRALPVAPLVLPWSRPSLFAPRRIIPARRVFVYNDSTGTRQAAGGAKAGRGTAMATEGGGVTIREDRDGYYFLLEDGNYSSRRIVHMKKAEHGYRGFVPSFPGLTATGDTLEDVRAQLAQGIGERLDTMRG